MAEPKYQEQQATEQEQQLFDIASQKMGNYRDNGIPLENDYLADINSQLVNGSVRTNAGPAMAAANKQWSPMMQATQDPNRGNGYQSFLGDKVKSDANISAGARFGQQSGYLQDLAGAATMGRQLQQPLLQGMGNQAQVAATKAQQDSVNSLSDSVDNQNAFSMLGGMGMQYGLRNTQTLNPNGSFIKGAFDDKLRSGAGSYLGGFFS